MTANPFKGNYEIIDSHAHIYPGKIADKASVTIGEFYNIKMNYNGTVDKLLTEGKKAGVNKFLVHSVATTPHQVSRINVFLTEEITKHSEFIGFMTLHPDMEEAEIEAEIELGIKNGFKGIKLHPDFQKFHADGIRAHKMFEILNGRLPVLFHAGDNRFDFSHPDKIAHVAQDFPKMTVIAAHFGGYSEWDKLDCYQGRKNVYFDTSSALFALPPMQAKAYIEKYGADKFFFGTDYPMWDANDELNRLAALQLADSDVKLVLAENLKRVLGL